MVCLIGASLEIYGDREDLCSINVKPKLILSFKFSTWTYFIFLCSSLAAVCPVLNHTYTSSAAMCMVFTCGIHLRQMLQIKGHVQSVYRYVGELSSFSVARILQRGIAGGVVALWFTCKVSIVLQIKRHGFKP